MSSTDDANKNGQVFDIADLQDSTKLKYFHSLGFRDSQKVRIIQHMDNDEEIVYLVGHHVALYNYEKRAHRFVLKSPKTAEIYGFSVSPNRKYIAISERIISEPKPEGSGKKEKTGSEKKEVETSPPDVIQISIYNFKTAARSRTLNFPSAMTSQILTMDFSKEGKYLSAVTSEPDSTIYMWRLEQSKKIATKKITFPIVQLSMNPYSYWQLATTGPECIKIFRYTEGELKYFDPVQDSNKYTYMCHAWFAENKLVVGTGQGHILVVDGQQVVKEITNAHPGGYGILCIEAVHRGFICAGDGGYFSVFERTYDSEHFNHYRKFRTHERTKILDLCISKREDHVICCYENNQLSHFSLANVDILKENENNFTLLPLGFHGDLVTGMDICIQKSIIATCGSDRTIRIWNYMKRSVELYKEFVDDQIYSISLHPTGNRMLVGFRYKLILFDILVDSLHESCSWQIKSCKLVKFSNCGDRFAAVSVTSILILSTYNFQVLVTLRGHSGMVRSLYWSEDDRKMVSAGYEGTVYEWKLDEDKKRVHENIVKTCAFRYLVHDDSTGITAAIGNDKKIWTFKESALEVEIPTKEDLQVLSLSRSSSTLFVGTGDGKLLLYRWPPNDFHYREYHIHTGPVVALMLSYEERFLFSVGADGSLFMLELDSLVDGRRIIRKSFDFEACEDVYYSLKTQQEEREVLVRELELKLTQIQNEYERKLQIRNEQHESEMRRVKDQLTEEIKLTKDKIHLNKQTASEQEAHWKEREAQMEAQHFKAAEAIQFAFDKSLQELQHKYQKMLDEKDNALSDYTDLLVKLHKDHNIQQEMSKYEKEQVKIDLAHQLTSLKNDLLDMKKQYDTNTKMREEDFVKESEIIASKLNERIDKQKNIIDAERGMAALQTAKVEDKEKQIRDRKREVIKLQDDIKSLQKQRDEDRTVIDSLNKELAARQDTIAISEKKLSEYDKQATELESIRYVLTYKYKQLSEVVTPKDELIKEMRENLKGTDLELQRVRVETENLHSHIVAKNEKIDLLQKHVNKNKQIADDKHRLINSLLREIGELAGTGDPKLTNMQLKRLVTKYSAFLYKSIEAEKTDKDKDTLQEFERQRDFMEQSMSGMKKTMSHKEIHLKADLGRKNNENSVLVEEVNQLRKEQKKHKQRILSLEGQLKNALYGGQTELAAIVSPNSEDELESNIKTPSKLTKKRFSSASISRPISSGSVATLGRIRTPDSYFSHSSASSSRGTNRGKLVIGSTTATIEPRPDNGFIVNKDRDIPSSLDRTKVAEFVATLDKNTKKFEEQQEQIGKLKDYVQHLLKSTTNVDPLESDALSGQTTNRSFKKWLKYLAATASHRGLNM
ncbi:flagella-associated protein [Acrasis kona]|uniref:Flagella-associated protein n=1 Tax=Acrasis kona TaxID=1008807 RepID=A0AAW2Z3P8_9EUKA